MTNYLLIILLIDGLLWLRSAMGKVSGGKFVGDLGGTLEKFASKNPYPAVKEFLQSVAIPNSEAFGLLTMYGELLSALAVLGGAFCLLTKHNTKLMSKVLLVGLLGVSFLNLVFWFASGWTSPSTDSVNLMMLSVQVVGIFALVKTAKS